MFTHPDITGQLVREHHRQILAAARPRTPRRQHGRPVSTATGIAAVIRRLVTVTAPAFL